MLHADIEAAARLRGDLSTWPRSSGKVIVTFTQIPDVSPDIRRGYHRI
jgi:hypothetical protein